MPLKLPTKQTTIYGIWDTELGEWFVSIAGTTRKRTTSWVHEGLAKRAFILRKHERFDEQTRFVMVPLTVHLDLAA